MKKRIVLAFASVAMLAFLSGCGKVPQVQIDAANAAVLAAQAAEADVYVPAEFAALQDSLNAALQEVETQKAKTFKRFGAVTVRLEAIAPAAEIVIANAAAAKEVVRLEATTLFEETAVLLAENVELMKKAPRGKGGAAVLEAIKNETLVIEGSIAEARAMFEQGNYMGARERVKAAKESVLAINTELKDAIAKVRGGR